MTELADNVRIKGQSLRVEINRLRGPKAEQFFSDLTIRKGDRLQFAVWVDRPSTLDIVLVDEATQTHIPLANAEAFSAGRTDVTPVNSQRSQMTTRARLLVGPPDAVRTILAGGESQAVKVIRLSPETKP